LKQNRLENDDRKFLLIINRNESTSLDALRALSSFGDLKVLSEEDALDEILQQNYNLVVVDASSVNEPAQLITEILAETWRIVVTSVAPTWQEIRSVLTRALSTLFASR
jgi:hypothetical protein